MSVAVIINPKSGRGSSTGARQRVLDLLAAAGESGEVLCTERRGHARELASAAAADGARLVVAWGGDGTVNEVASALAGSDTALGIVPAGSGNGLARELHVDRRPDWAIRDAMRATPRLIDAGELAGRFFVNIAGVGFDAHVAACFDADAGARRGLPAYLRVSTRELWRYESGRYRIDGASARKALLIAVANTTQFGNGARIAPFARMDDGMLDLVMVEERSRLATLAALPRLFAGGLARVAGVTMRQIETAVIESERPMTIHVDGEPAGGGTRLEVRVLPSALRVSVR
jgi:YegS/Rv2252/BmrU family lipid kinase